MISPWKAAAAAAIVAVIAACTSPTLVCGCVFPPPDALVRGVVRTAAGAPVAGARVQALAMPAGCDLATARAAALPSGRPRSAADGSYEIRFISVAHGADECLRVVAERADGATAFTEVAVLRYSPGADGLPVPHQVDVTFP